MIDDSVYARVMSGEVIREIRAHAILYEGMGYMH